MPDVLAGLTEFARVWRRDFPGAVVGITGSNGKTTVKEMTGAILARMIADGTIRAGDVRTPDELVTGAIYERMVREMGAEGMVFRESGVDSSE